MEEREDMDFRLTDFGNGDWGYEVATPTGSAVDVVNGDTSGQQVAEWLADGIARHVPGVGRGDLLQEVRRRMAGDRSAVNSAEKLAGRWVPRVVRMSDVEPEEVEWLWPGWVPSGCITAVAGKPGVGKSFSAVDMAARISSGTAWPDGSDCPRGSVLILPAEDSPAGVILARLQAQGADLTKIHCLEVMDFTNSSGETDTRRVTLADVAYVQDVVSRVGDVKLIIIDPINSFFPGKVDTHKDNQVRESLTPWADMARQCNLSVVQVTHHSKSSDRDHADDMVMGSVAFVGLARAVIHVMAETDESDTRVLFLPGKTNLGPAPKGLAFRVSRQSGRLEWSKETVDVTASQHLASRRSCRRKPSEVDKCVEWLRGRLGQNVVLMTKVEEDWKETGGSDATLRRAKKSLKVECDRPLSTGPWYWRMPDVPALTHAPPGETVEHLEHVGDFSGFSRGSGAPGTPGAQVCVSGEGVEHVGQSWGDV